MTLWRNFAIVRASARNALSRNHPLRGRGDDGKHFAASVGAASSLEAGR
jgi:hypothetical protein